MNANQILGTLYQVIAIAAAIAASLVICKAAGVDVPVRGSMQDWTWVTIACAAAKFAR